jgi:hypothetical protein
MPPAQFLARGAAPAAGDVIAHNFHSGQPFRLAGIAGYRCG